MCYHSPAQGLGWGSTGQLGTQGSEGKRVKLPGKGGCDLWESEKESFTGLEREQSMVIALFVGQ